MSKLQLLVPLDGTDFSRKIEPQILKLFPPDRWELRLLHVSRVPVDPAAAAYEPAAVGPDYRLYMYGYEMPGATLHPVYDEERLEEFRESLERDLQYEVKLFEDQGYTVDAAVHFGEPANAIVSYAQETDVDVVAMATHHRRGLERLIHGSVARRALSHLHIPALLLSVESDEEERVNDQNDDGHRMNRNNSGAAQSRGQHDGEGTKQADPGARMPDTAGHTSVRKDDNVVTPADTHPATLGGIQGRGVLTVLRGDDGRVVGTQGSWFPADPQSEIESLEQAQQVARNVLFEGRLFGAETAGSDDETGQQVRREVSVTSVRRYQDYGGDSRILVSFELVGEPDQTDVPEQYTRSEFDRLDLAQVSAITGLDMPASLTPEEEASFREKAWKSYELDIEHRDEWGTARQNAPLPRGE